MAATRITVRSLTGVVVALVVSGWGLAACGDDGGTTANVTLSEWIVEPDPASVDAGEIEFVGDNKGGETHELVVVRARSADELPTDSDGAVDEEQLPEGALIGEIEDIESESSKSVKLDLETGDYVLFCNITEEQADGSIESHFAEGMHSGFAVE
jgi:hypothetical protein